MKNFILIFLVSLLTVVSIETLTLKGGAKADIININSRSNNQSNPVKVFLEAGSYLVEPIGTADGGAFNAWNPWSRTSCGNSDGCIRTSPTTVTGWMNVYQVMSSNITAVTIESSPGTINPDIPGYRVDDGFVYPAAIIAQAKAQSSVFTLSVSGEVGFAIRDLDFALSDNSGGMSLLVTLESANKIAILKESLPAAIKLGEFSLHQLEAVNGISPYSWSVIDGTLTPGMNLSSDGVFSGTPTELGASTFTVMVTDSNGDIAEKEFTVEVVFILSPPDIRINKVGTVAVPGRVLDYFAVVENIGSVTAKDINVTELLEPWFTFISAVPTPSSIEKIVDIFPLPEDSEAEYDALINWTIPIINPGDARIIFYKVELDPTFPLGEIVSGSLCPSDEQIQCTADLGICMGAWSLGCAIHPPTYPVCLAGGWTICLADFLKCMVNAGSCGSHKQITVAPIDPNEKLVIAKRYIQPDQQLVYPIHFENVGDVEALDVFITDVFDPNLDISTLELITPEGASFDEATRTLKWDLLGRNLQPGETGNVLLSIRPLPNLPSGTEIRNSAAIQFEIFDLFITNEVVNIIDTTLPDSVMDALPAVTATLDFPISWSGTDDVGEIDNYSIFVSVDGGGFRPYLERTQETSTTFSGEGGKTYEFLCVAADTAGNIEVQDAVAEAVTTIMLDVAVIVNDLVSFVPLVSTYDTTTNTTGCPDGYVGKFSFYAKLENTSSSTLSNLAVKVAELTGGNLLRNADGGSGEENSMLTIGELSPGESVDVYFEICLKQLSSFSFFVDVLGLPIS